MIHPSGDYFSAWEARGLVEKRLEKSPVLKSIFRRAKKAAANGKAEITYQPTTRLSMNDADGLVAAVRNKGFEISYDFRLKGEKEFPQWRDNKDDEKIRKQKGFVRFEVSWRGENKYDGAD